MDEKTKEAAKWAEEMSKELPSEYKVAGFQEFLRYRLAISEERNLAPDLPIAPNDQDYPKDHKKQPTDWISDLVSEIPADHLIRESGSEDQKVAWAVINLANKGHEGINRAISEYIRFNLGIAPPSRQNINRALRNLFPKYLSREKHEKTRSYAYMPKPAVKETFAKLKSNK